eukprot:12112004-Alexandrium_andersonii.AAC.1
MSASLVGSEMCIRDSLCHSARRAYLLQRAGCSGTRPLLLRKGRRLRHWGPRALMPKSDRADAPPYVEMRQRLNCSQPPPGGQGAWRPRAERRRPAACRSRSSAPWAGRASRAAGTCPVPAIWQSRASATWSAGPPRR